MTTEMEMSVEVKGRDWASPEYVEGCVHIKHQDEDDYEVDDSFPFNKNVDNGDIEFFNPSKSGWITGASYDQPLPDWFPYEDAVNSVDEAVDDFLVNEEEKAKAAKTNVGSLKEKIAGVKGDAGKAEKGKENKNEGR